MGLGLEPWGPGSRALALTHISLSAKGLGVGWGLYVESCPWQLHRQHSILLLATPASWTYGLLP